MQHSRLHTNGNITSVEYTYDQDASAIEQLRLRWQQLRAMQQQTITIECMPNALGIDESTCVEGSLSEVRDE